MGVLSELEPKPVFRFFEEICAIPHGSYDTKRISDYCVKFAEERQLFYIQDKWNNVLIVKEASPGYEESETIMLQGHLDMVCEKAPDSEFDFGNDSLDLYIDGDFVRARGTTLGGDDGIAVAYGLAILDDDKLQHPRLEVLFTSEEEVGMDGAKGFDASVLKATKLLNLDSEEEGYLLTGCAGGFRGTCILPLQRERATGQVYKLVMSGLQGGHSGIEIDKGRANASKELARILRLLREQVDYQLLHIEGGKKDNAIPNYAYAEIIITNNQNKQLQEAVKAAEKMLKNEYRVTDPGITLTVDTMKLGEAEALTKESLEQVLLFLNQVPSGICRMSADIAGHVQTSLNLGILMMDQVQCRASFAVRSSVDSELEELDARLRQLTEYLGGKYEMHGDYPAWEYREESELRTVMIDVYQQMFGKEPIVEVIHAGLECGILLDKRDMDCVSIGPDMFDVHTVDEKLSIASTGRTWEYLLEVLKACK